MGKFMWRQSEGTTVYSHREFPMAVVPLLMALMQPTYC